MVLSLLEGLDIHVSWRTSLELCLSGQFCFCFWLHTVFKTSLQTTRDTRLSHETLLTGRIVNIPQIPGAASLLLSFIKHK